MSNLRIRRTLDSEIARKNHGPRWRPGWTRFRKHRPAVIAVIVLLLLILGAALAPWLTPYDYTRQDLTNAFSAPSFTVPDGADSVQSCLRARVLWFRCGMHPFGTDDLGRDIFTRILHGGRVSLLVGFLSALMATLAGTAVGAVAAYFGGTVDAVLSRCVDIMLSIPPLPILLILAGVLADRESLLFTTLEGVFGATRSGAIVIIVIASFSWMSTARLVRGQVLALRERDFVGAAKAIGASRTRILVRHILPDVAPLIVVQATLAVGRAILIESSLSFLGLGIQAPSVSWGNMLTRAQYFSLYPNGIYLVLFPGLALLAVVLSVNVLGDGLRDALDPRMPF